MIATTLISLLGLAQIPFSDAPTVRTVVVPVATCPTCGIRLSTVAATINRLRSSPRPNDRENAAEALREIRPKCHPDVVEALSDALVRDPAPSVRREAAETLARQGAAQPESHAALAFAASRDPSPFVRHQAVKGLRAKRGRCPADCPICGPAALPTHGEIAIEERPIPDALTTATPTPERASLPGAIAPPPPTPAPFGSTRPVPPAPGPRVIVSSPKAVDPVVRRSSAKPAEAPTQVLSPATVAPAPTTPSSTRPADLPTQVLPPVTISPKPSTPKPPPATTPKPATAPDFPPLEAPSG